MILFYVNDPMAGADFYTKLLGEAPIDASPGFAMFKLNNGTMLGLWNAKGVQPTPTAAAGASELGFLVSDSNEVAAYHQRWLAANLRIVQTPTLMDFGYTFTALDPDDHRLRVFSAV